MKFSQRLVILLLVIIISLGVSGCMDKRHMDNFLYGVSLDPNANDKTKQAMLEYIENKTHKDFTVVEFIPATRGFNDGMNESILVAKSPEGFLVNIREKVQSPEEFYDDYINASASFLGKDIIDYSKLSNVIKVKTYISLRLINIGNIDDMSKESLSISNVSHITSVINLKGVPTEDELKSLYDIYKQLEHTGYEDIFMIVGFTDNSLMYEKFVENYYVYGVRDWRDYDGKVYASMVIKEKGLSFDDFITKISYKE